MADLQAPKLGGYRSVLRSGLQQFPPARDFQRLFPGAEHRIVEAEHDFGTPVGWRSVFDWLSRARFHDRYVVTLSTAIDIGPDGTISQLKPPILDIFEVVQAIKGKNEKDGPKYECQWFGAEDGGWDSLVEVGGDFSQLGFEMTANQPVARFVTYWSDTGDGWASGTEFADRAE